MRCPSWPASVPSGAKPEALTLCQSRPLIVVAGGPVRVTRHLPCGAGSVRLDRHFPVIEPQPASVAKRATRLNENGLPCPCLCHAASITIPPCRQAGWAWVCVLILGLGAFSAIYGLGLLTIGALTDDRLSAGPRQPPICRPFGGLGPTYMKGLRPMAKKTTRKVSAAARKRMSQAQKARWRRAHRANSGGNTKGRKAAANPYLNLTVGQLVEATRELDDAWKLARRVLR